MRKSSLLCMRIFNIWGVWYPQGVLAPDTKTQLCRKQNAKSDTSQALLLVVFYEWGRWWWQVLRGHALGERGGWVGVSEWKAVQSHCFADSPIIFICFSCQQTSFLCIHGCGKGTPMTSTFLFKKDNWVTLTGPLLLHSLGSWNLEKQLRSCFWSLGLNCTDYGQWKQTGWSSWKGSTPGAQCRTDPSSHKHFKHLWAWEGRARGKERWRQAGGLACAPGATPSTSSKLSELERRKLVQWHFCFSIWSVATGYSHQPATPWEPWPCGSFCLHSQRESPAPLWGARASRTKAALYSSQCI